MGKEKAREPERRQLREGARECERGVRKRREQDTKRERAREGLMTGRVSKRERQKNIEVENCREDKKKGERQQGRKRGKDWRR